MIFMAQVLEQLDLGGTATDEKLYVAAIDLCIKQSIDIPYLPQQ